MMFEDHQYILDTLTSMAHLCEKENRQATGEERKRAGYFINLLNETEYQGGIPEFWTRPANPPHKPNPQDMGDGYVSQAQAIMPPPEISVMGFKPRGKTYRELFGLTNAKLDNGGWKPGEFLQVAASGRYDSRLVQAAMTEGQPSSGGFMVPVDLEAYVMDVSLFTEIVRNQAQVWPMGSGTLQVPGWNVLDMSGGDMAGFTMQFLGEGATATKQTGKVRLIELSANKGMIYGEASNELAFDAPNFEASLQYILAQAISYGYDKYFLTGTGAGHPLGVLSATNSLIVQDKEAGQAADTIQYENLANMWARMYPAGRRNAVWVANSDTLPQLMTLGIMVGVGGVHYPVLRESDGGYSIFGRPCYFTPVLPTLGDQGDICLVDLTQYAIGMRKGMALEFSIHPGFQEDMLSFRVVTRFDGQPLWNKYHSPENGATQSWAVTLEERA